ncbi:MAG TPA: DUF202 domain-containing protein [Streptosporangiaceae bacterium]|nr:DUF202 domain-containing protein [Streptosporangiaceae bacterium]
MTSAAGPPGQHPPGPPGQHPPRPPGQHPPRPSGQHPPRPSGARDPGLARERTALAWTRTAISFAAVGGVVLKRDIIPGLILLAVAPAIYLVGRVAYTRPEKHKLITATIVAVALVALVVALTSG